MDWDPLEDYYYRSFVVFSIAIIREKLYLKSFTYRFRKRNQYTMCWDKSNLGLYLIAMAPYGGPIGLL